jgi:hypothetical protein
MLDEISNLDGFSFIPKNGQRNIVGGLPRFCTDDKPCEYPYKCYSGICRLP